jgi:hypothetical protein
MLKPRYILFFLSLLCLCAGQLSAHQRHDKAFRSFWHPTYQGARLDYCTVDGKACGKQVASQYCQMLGYDYSNQHVIAHNVGLTNYLLTRARCTGWQCNGFMTIGCAVGVSHSPPKPYHYRQKRFVVPRYNAYRVDWCYSKGKGCGAKAAYSFCNRLGYIQAKRYVMERQVSATQTIGSQELCFGMPCRGFKEIICSR